MYAFISDIHLGTKLPKMDYLKSLNEILGIIKNNKEECHAIFICGDLFDHRLSIEESKFASIFLLNLVCNNCGRGNVKHVPVKFIHGTFSHDYDQYDIYLSILNKIDNVNIFYTKDICSSTLTNEAKVLYLPQLYGDIDYTKALSDKYDIIVGHGVISSQTKNPCPASTYDTILPTEKLGEISKICVFGHYHDYTDFGNNVYYSGSMLRWKYGEDVDKVFFICNDNFEVETIKNPFAKEYKTININDPETLRENISNDIETPHRFIINANKSDLTTYHAIMNMTKKNTNITYKIHTTKEDEDIKDEKNQLTNDISSNVIEPIPALVSYINDKYNIDVTDEIKDYETKINRDKDLKEN